MHDPGDEDKGHSGINNPEVPRFVRMIADDARAAGVSNVDMWEAWNTVSILVDTKTYEAVGADGGEPEDQTLGRDWKWVVDLLNKVAEERR